MGMRSRVALAILLLLVFLTVVWLQGGLESHWGWCLQSYTHTQLLIRVNVSRDTATDSVLLKECPGQDFQVSRLVSHLKATPAPDADILLQPYLSTWDELIKFLKALGPMVGIISQEIESKTGIIRQLAQQEDEGTGVTDAYLGFSGSYRSLRSMIHVELSRGLVDFQETTESGCRTLLRLHRALLWLRLFLLKLGEGPTPGGHPRAPSELCREAYQQTLARHHPWLVRRAAELAFMAMPDRSFFLRLVCARSQQEATPTLRLVVAAIDEVYVRTQGALEEHGMLDLP